MNTLSLWGIKDIAKPTPAKIGVDRIIRNQGYTTNGYWMIRTDLETKYTNKIREVEQKPEITKILDAVKDATNEMKIENRLAYHSSLVVALSCETFTTWINVYFLGMFSEVGMSLKFYQKDALAPMYVKNEKDEVIGVIMPIRVIE